MEQGQKKFFFSETKSFKLHPKLVKKSTKLSEGDAYVAKDTFDDRSSKLFLKFLEVQTGCKVDVCHVNELFIAQEGTLISTLGSMSTTMHRWLE